MEIKIIRSRRKTISLEIGLDLVVILRVPMGISEKEIEEILKRKESWIIYHLESMKNKKKKIEDLSLPKLSNSEIRALADQALTYIPDRVKYFANLMNVTYGKITIRNQKTRWGSCSSSGNLNFNCKLMLTPPEVIDYVIVHELCHRLQMNHSKKFWHEVEKVLPDYKIQKNWLKSHNIL